MLYVPSLLDAILVAVWSVFAYYDTLVELMLTLHLPLLFYTFR
jgi:hypothetical protein